MEYHEGGRTPNALTKAKLMATIAERLQITRAQADRLIDSLLATTRTELRSGRTLTWPHIGTFFVGKRAARAIMWPRSHAAHKLPAAKIPKMRATHGVRAKI